MKRGYGVTEIADMLEEEVTTVQEICDVVNEMGYDSSPEAILGRWNEKKSVIKNQSA